jgi:hypothetical protein
MAINVLSSSGTSASLALGNLASAAARPNFELAFNNLQNSILGRLDKEIKAFSEAGEINNVDAFLRLEQQRLTALQPVVTKYAQEVVNTRQHVAEALEAAIGLGELAQQGDADAFNTALADLNARIANTPSANGAQIGIYTDDGLGALRQSGLGVAEWTDQATAEEQVSAAVLRLTDLLSVYNVRQDDASGLFDQANERLATVTQQIVSSQLEDKQAALEKVTKLKEHYGYMLQSLSLAFEVQQQQNDSIQKTLLDPGQAATGSILNLFA